MDPAAIARRFAAALDRGDHPEAAACLREDCEYTAMGTTHRGPAAIVATYQESWDWAAAHLAEVRYDSTVRATGPASAVVTFADHTEHAGVSHSYRSEQHLSVDETGRIHRIEHRELPGEREALLAFFARVGVSRSG